MKRDEIEKLLPHRGGMLLLDELELVGEESRGKYRVRGDEWFLDGHFPDFKIVPGVVLCEILAQSACVLISSGGGLAVYTGLKDVKFSAPVLPGDVFETSCKLTRSKPPFYFAEGTGSVNGQLRVKASFSFALTDIKTLCSQKS